MSHSKNLLVIWENSWLIVKQQTDDDDMIWYDINYKVILPIARSYKKNKKKVEQVQFN